MVFNKDIDAIKQDQTKLINLVAKVLKFTNTSKVTIDSIRSGSTVVRFGVEVEEGSDTYTTESEIQSALQNSTSSESNEFADYDPVPNSVSVVDTEGSESLPEATNTGNAATEAPEEDNSTTTIILLIVILVVTLAIIACVAVYCYTQQKKQDRQDAATKLDKRQKRPVNQEPTSIGYGTTGATTATTATTYSDNNNGSTSYDPDTETSDAAQNNGQNFPMHSIQQHNGGAAQYSPANNDDDGGFHDLSAKPVRHEDVELNERR